MIADSSKLVERIGKFPLPVEVLPFARAKVMRAIAVMGGEPRLRDGGDRKDGPLVTDNGNFIVDASFKEIIDPRALEIEIKMVPGVVEVGSSSGWHTAHTLGTARGSGSSAGAEMIRSSAGDGTRTRDFRISHRAPCPGLRL